MADEEQFSLCWNNFNTNLSAGFHESLCRGDLVDVTLCAEGQLVRAHRLVLSVCSPYFRKMFTQMPANQHAFIFMKDVSHTVLKDLIQFMYCGEVNVKQDALPTFISTAEALQIKGLTETGESAAPSVTPHPLPSSAINAASAAAASAAPASAAAVPAKVAPAAAATTTTVVAQSSNTVTATTRNASPTRQQQQQQSAQASQQQARYVQRQRQATTSITSNTSSNYKLDSEDSSDERVIIATQQQHQQQTHKRTQQQRGSLSHQQQNVAKRQRHISNAQEQAHSAAAVEPSATVVHVQQQQQQQQIVQVQVHQPQQQAIIAAVQLKDHDASSSLADAEFIDLPIEMAAANTSGGSAVVVSAKSEPDYEELGDVETIEQEQDQEMAEEEEEEAEDEEHDHQQHHEQQLHHHHEQQEHEQEEEHDDEQQQVAEGEEEATYVEDDQYGDMKYDESYFTENDESKAGGGASGGQSGYDDSYAAQEAADASGTEAQAKPIKIESDNEQPSRKPTQPQPPPTTQTAPRDRHVQFVRSLRSGQRLLQLDGQWRYTQHTENDMLVFWRCAHRQRSNCPAEVATTKCETTARVWVINDTHIHKQRPKFTAPLTVPSTSQRAEAWAQPLASTAPTTSNAENNKNEAKASNAPERSLDANGGAADAGQSERQKSVSPALSAMSSISSSTSSSSVKSVKSLKSGKHKVAEKQL